MAKRLIPALSFIFGAWLPEIIGHYYSVCLCGELIAVYPSLTSIIDAGLLCAIFSGTTSILVVHHRWAILEKSAVIVLFVAFLLYTFAFTAIVAAASWYLQLSLPALVLVSLLALLINLAWIGSKEQAASSAGAGSTR